ncbi:hypothetical protein [Arthrobacter sp. EpRS71]|uniref:hypothetical protein n=1 Tax=Arthrobacter sp. EpRS71 TaxID=1743141 RepID=UPI000746119C|nr:hypothetical protein [Arthrobacter sp. EpRS71]KUM34576.1 hypothetical protein AR689_10570 [Arthrobacter sp. EpRS71]
MSKPLELHVYKIWENSLNGAAYCSAFTSDQDPGYPVNVDLAVLQKRLSEHELAAEVWHSIVKFYSKEPSTDAVEEACRNAVIERFATFPHYDETTP